MQVSQLTDMLDMSGAGALKVTFHHCNSGAERSLTGRLDMHETFVKIIDNLRFLLLFK